jgi:hypothetical protein
MSYQIYDKIESCKNVNFSAAKGLRIDLSFNIYTSFIINLEYVISESFTLCLLV